MIRATVIHVTVIRAATDCSPPIKNVGMQALIAWRTQSLVCWLVPTDRCNSMQRSAPGLISSRFLVPIVGVPVVPEFSTRTSSERGSCTQY